MPGILVHSDLLPPFWRLMHLLHFYDKLLSAGHQHELSQYDQRQAVDQICRSAQKRIGSQQDTSKIIIYIKVCRSKQYAHWCGHVMINKCLTLHSDAYRAVNMRITFLRFSIYNQYLFSVVTECFIYAIFI